MKGNFYKDAMEYYREKNSPMAAELYIPCGMFRPKNDHDFVESPMVLMSGAGRGGERGGDKIFRIELRFDRHVFRVLALDDFGELGIHADNILSGFFRVLGKVKRSGENS